MRITNVGNQLEIAADTEQSSSTASKEQYLAFDRKRRAIGVRFGIMSALCLVGGAAIVSHAHSSHAMRMILLVDFYVAAFVLLIGSLFLLIHAARNLAGGIILSESGLRFTPMFFRGQISWRSIKRWDVCRTDSVQMIRLNVRRKDETESVVISNAFLPKESLKTLEQALRLRIPFQEIR